MQLKWVVQHFRQLILFMTSHLLSLLIEFELGDHRQITEEMREHFVNETGDTSDDDKEEEWLDENHVDFNRNAFDVIIDNEQE